MISLKLNSNLDKGSVGAMQKDMPLMQNVITQLNGICMVIEAMVSSFDESVHAQVNDLHQLLEDTTKAKQVRFCKDCSIVFQIHINLNSVKCSCNNVRDMSQILVQNYPFPILS